MDFTNNGTLSQIGTGTINNLTFEIDPRGLSRLSEFSSGGQEFMFGLIARYSSSANTVGSNTAIINAGGIRSKPFGDVNPVIPNAPFEIKFNTMHLVAPSNSISRYLHIHTRMDAGRVHSGGVVQVNDTVSVGIKPSLDTYVSYNVTGDTSGVDLARPMEDFLNSTDVNGNTIGDYVPLT